MNTTYQTDRDFLAECTPVIEMSDGHARVLVAPALQGRVMTSTLAGESGRSFGWINRPFISARAENPQFNNYGGEDRFCLGPEGGQYGLWFRPGDRFTLDDFRAPACLNSGAFAVPSRTAHAVVLTRRFSVTNYAGTSFDCSIRRTTRLLDAEATAVALAAPIPRGLRWVAFETVNQLTNAGAKPWQREAGLLCIWIRGMFRPLASGHVMVPFAPGDERQFGPRVNTYFGAIPPGRLQVAEDHLRFACDGACRARIGIPPRRAQGVIGSWDPDGGVLTVISFNLPAAAHRLPYVNSRWEIQKDPYAGDVVNSYNDGQDGITGRVWEPFYEMETSSPGAELAPGETLVHAHRTFHFAGPINQLDALAGRIGISPRCG